MTFFFLGEPSSNFKYTCKYCNQTYYERNNSIVQCACAAAQQAGLEEKQRLAAFEQARKVVEPSFREICEARKLRTGKRPPG